MPTLPIIYWLPPSVTCAITAGLACVIRLRLKTPAASALALYLLSIAIWSICYPLQLSAQTFEGKLFWSKLGYVGPAGVSLAGFVFVIHYSGFNDWLRTRRLVLLALIPALTQVLAWSNEKHGLIWRRIWLASAAPFQMLARIHGPWFWVFLTYSYALCIVSILLLFRVLIHRTGIYRAQAALLLMGCMVPFAGNFIYSFSTSAVPAIDFTVYGFCLTGVSMAWALLRFQLPLIMPLARQRVFEGMSDAVIALDVRGNIVEINPEAARVLGQISARLIGRPAATAFSAFPDLAEFCEHPCDDQTAITIERNGIPRRFDAKWSLLKETRGQTIGALVVLRDITEREAAEVALRQAHLLLEQRIAERTADLSRTIVELRQMEEKLSYSASHDSLTGLANRKLFLERVSSRLKDATEKTVSFAVIYIDLDRFKVYNDGYGHHLGDLILVEMGQRLLTCLTPSDLVARMGGDEFTILFDAPQSVSDASRLAQTCLEALARPAWIGGNEVLLTASIGVAFGSHGCTEAEALVRDADLAMYRAKRHGGNQVQFFGDSMRSSALSLVQLERDLRLALARGEMIVRYQPFVRFETGKIVGFEALVRWRHPTRGLLAPAEFLPIAEQSGVLMAIDEFVLREACQQKTRWVRASSSEAEPPFVSVNISGWQLAHPNRWWQALAALKSEAVGLRLEMVESVLAENPGATIEFFEHVRAHNLEVYLDDFGTGHSSLSRLSHFPIRSLKIDRSFVKGIVNDEKDVSLIKAIVALADSLKMEVTAEGIESPGQSDALQSLGCEYGQGFYFSPPVDGPATLAMLN